MHVIVNWGGSVNYSLTRIENLTRMMQSKGYEVGLIEKDARRSRWLVENLGEDVVHLGSSAPKVYSDRT